MKIAQKLQYYDMFILIHFLMTDEMHFKKTTQVLCDVDGDDAGKKMILLFNMLARV